MISSFVNKRSAIALEYEEASSETTRVVALQDDLQERRMSVLDASADSKSGEPDFATIVQLVIFRQENDY
jgi:hypothetical protein